MTSFKNSVLENVNPIKSENKRTYESNKEVLGKYLVSVNPVSRNLTEMGIRLGKNM